MVDLEFRDVETLAHEIDWSDIFSEQLRQRYIHPTYKVANFTSVILWSGRL